MTPWIPEGTALESVIDVHEYLGGKSTLPGRYVLAQARWASTSYFEGRKDLWQTLLDHTFLPILLAAVSASTKNEMQLDDPSSETFNKSWGRLQPAMPKKSARYRRCPSCVKDDILEHGVAFLRTLHQVSALHKCTTHGVPLEEMCSGCGAAFKSGPNRRAMIHLCYQCGSTRGVPLNRRSSGGYEAFAKLLGCTLAGRVPQVEPPQLLIALDRFAELTIEYRVDVCAMFVKFWASKNLPDACSKSTVDVLEIRRALLFGTRPGRVLAAYVLISFFHSVVVHSSAVCASDKVIAKHLPKHIRIRDRALDFGMPMPIVSMLAAGDWRTIIQLGYPLKEVRRFLASLDGIQQLFIQGRRVLFLGARLSRLHLHDGKVIRPAEVRVKGSEACALLKKVAQISARLGFPCEVDFQPEIPVGLPQISIDGVVVAAEHSSEIVGYVLQRTQFWPQAGGRWTLRMSRLLEPYERTANKIGLTIVDRP